MFILFLEVKYFLHLILRFCSLNLNYSCLIIIFRKQSSPFISFVTLFNFTFSYLFILMFISRHLLPNLIFVVQLSLKRVDFSTIIVISNLFEVYEQYFNVISLIILFIFVIFTFLIIFFPLLICFTILNEVFDLYFPALFHLSLDSANLLNA